VAAALEAALRDVPSIAFSVARQRPQDFSHAAAFVKVLVREVLERGAEAIPRGALLNVNFPPGAIVGYRVTRLGRRVYRDQVDVRQDLRGRHYYWIGGPEEKAEDIPGSDCTVVNSSLASITPLALDLTHRHLAEEIEAWKIGDFVQNRDLRITTEDQ